MNVNSQKEIDMVADRMKNAHQGFIYRLSKKKQGGFGLPELAITLMITGLIAAAAMIVVPRILASVRADKIIDEFNTAIPAIQTAYQNQTTYSSLTTAQVAQNGWVGSSFIEYSGGVPTGKLLTQWGTMAFAPIASGARAQTTLDNIPSRECVKIGNSFTNDLYLTATINGTTVKTNINTVDLTAVGTQCSSTTTNTIVFTFGRS